MIRVAFDVTSYLQSPYGGIAQTCLNTIHQASAHREVEACAYYRRGKSGRVDLFGVPLIRMPLLPLAPAKEYDVVHALCHRRPRLKGRNLVYTVHDVWSLVPNNYQSAAFQRKVGRRMRREIARADLVITDSECTRESLLALELVETDRCRTVPLGVRIPQYNDLTSEKSKVARTPDRPYVLFVGRLENRKNLGHVLAAVAPLSQLDLVLVGEPGFGYEENIRGLLDRFPHDRRHLFSRVPPAELAGLYFGATATLLPSLEEGFGLPILEAMAHKSPVITSNCSACAEVAGEAAIKVDPADPDQSRAALQRLLHDSVWRSSLVEAGLKRAGMFSWSRYFENLISAYRSLLS